MIKKALAVLTSAMITVSAVCAGGISASAASGATGVGLAEHAMEAYYEDWSYVYGGSSEGAVDCSGLFVTYYGVGGNRTNLVGSASEVGYVSNGIPRIHGLGLWQPGHVGIYVGGGMAVDARDEASDMVYHNVSSKKWQKWFKVAGVNYPTTGWQTFEGNRYYYENGQYIVNCTRVIDGKTYTFNSSGIANGGSAATSDQIAQAEAKKEAAAAEKAAAQAAAAAAAEKAAEEEAAAKKKAEEEAAAKKAAEEKARKEAEEKAAAEKKAAEEAAAAKKAAETAATEQGSQLAQTLLTETIPLEEKSMPRVKSAVLPQVEQTVEAGAGMTTAVVAAALMLTGAIFFVMFKIKTTGQILMVKTGQLRRAATRMEIRLAKKARNAPKHFRKK